MEYRDYPNSSNVDRIAFYMGIEALVGPEPVDVLTVRFRSGQAYAYWNVSPPQWEQLRDCEGSIGSLIHKAIVLPAGRGEYISRKLEGPTLGAVNPSAARQEAERAEADQIDAEQGELAPTSVLTPPSAIPAKAPRRRVSRPR